MKLKSSYLAISLLLLVLPAYAATYHIDPIAGSSGGNGSAQSPFKRWSDLPSMVGGDDVYFKCNTTLVLSNSISIKWQGTGTNPVVIGAYYMRNGSPVYGVSGARPIISGRNYTVPPQGSSSGLINVASKDFVQIKNLHIYQSGGQGINITGDFSNSNSAHFLIESVRIEGAFKSGILVAKNPKNYGFIENCEISGAGYGWHIKAPEQRTWPVTISIAHCPYANTTIRGNYVHENWGEGIGVWRDNRTIANNSGHSTIQNNIIWNNRRVDIYIDSTDHNIVRRNICIGINDREFASISSDGRYWNQYGIWVNNEVYNGVAYPADHNKIVNNLVAGHYSGIGLASGTDNGIMTGNVFYNNTLIGNKYNWSIAANHLSGYQINDIEFKNNISYCPPDTICQDVRGDASWFDNKFIAENNAWTEIPRYFGNPNKDRLTNDLWHKTYGWQDLKSVPSLQDFMPREGNPVIGGGLPTDFSTAISLHGTKYQVSPLDISVVTVDRNDINGGRWDLGAVVTYDGYNELTPPTLKIIADLN